MHFLPLTSLFTLTLWGCDRLPNRWPFEERAAFLRQCAKDFIPSICPCVADALERGLPWSEAESYVRNGTLFEHSTEAIKACGRNTPGSPWPSAVATGFVEGCSEKADKKYCECVMVGLAEKVHWTEMVGPDPGAMKADPRVTAATKEAAPRCAQFFAGPNGTWPDAYVESTVAQCAKAADEDACKCFADQMKSNLAFADIRRLGQGDAAVDARVSAGKRKAANACGLRLQSAAPPPHPRKKKSN
jgi:hypothetical protein